MSNNRFRDQAKKKIFREFVKLPQRYIKRNYLKNIRQCLLETQKSGDVFQKELLFMCWAYDLEFFTLDYAAKNYKYSKQKVFDRLVNPLRHAGYIHKYFDKLTPSQTAEDHLFREETKMNYRCRYALTRKARLLVQRLYRNLETGENR